MGDWSWQNWLIFSIPLILLALAAVLALVLRNTIRTRYRVAKQLRDDPDINEWIVAFHWSRKIVYVPTILVSVVLGILALIMPAYLSVYGAIWLAVFFGNFLVDEYEMSIKIIAIFVLVAVALALWLSLLGWLMPFLGFFRELRITLDARAYFIIAGIYSLAIVTSWVRGLFYYVAITPNYLNIQVGPTETGEQISREEYSTRIDTGDFLERLSGFGRIIITFADQRRQPMVLLVGRIGTVARRLESIRGKLAMDRFQPAREGSEGMI